MNKKNITLIKTLSITGIVLILSMTLFACNETDEEISESTSISEETSGGTSMSQSISESSESGTSEISSDNESVDSSSNESSGSSETPVNTPTNNPTANPTAKPTSKPTSEPVNNSGVFYVSPNGDDNAAGTIEQPLLTMNGARVAVNDYLYRTETLTKDVYVYFREGTYVDQYTTMFTSEDSGKNGKKIIYSGYQNEKAVISTGVVLKNWANADSEFSGVSGVYKIKLPEGIEDIYCLYENDKRAVPARYPNLLNGYPRYLELASGTNASGLQAKVDRNDIPAGADYSKAQMVVWPGSHNNGQLQFDWYSSVNPIVSYNTTSAVFKLKLPTWWDITLGNRYYIQNVKSFIDVPGEFFYDKDSRYVYYKPYGDIRKVQIIAPSRATSIHFLGESDDPVKDIVFKNLSFGNSNFGESFSAAADAKRFEGMIKFENAQNILIDSCHLFNSGYNAVSMHGRNSNNSVINSLIENCGIGGVMIGVDDSQFPSKFSKPEDGQISKNNTVKNNLIRNVGQTSPGHGYGVFVHQSGYNVVKQNTFYRIPKAAINLYNRQTGYFVNTSLGGLSVNASNVDRFKYCRENEISFNHIYDVMYDGADCGGIILYGVGYGNKIDNNFLHDYSGLATGVTMGIYLDDNSDGVEITNNVVARIGGSHWVNGAMLKGRDITLNNNIFYNTRSSTYGVISTMITRVATWGMPQEQTHDFVNTNNIVYEDKTVQNLYYHFGFNYQFTTIKEQNNNTYFIPNQPNVGYALYVDDTSGSGDRWSAVSFATHQQTMRDLGIEIDSNVSWANPKFIDPTNNNFSLASDSPALALGFKPISLSNVGISSSFPFKESMGEAKTLANKRNTK